MKQFFAKPAAPRPARLPAWAGWLAGYAAALLGSAALVYGWRVFYEFNRLGALPLTLCAWGVATLLYGAVFAAVRFARSLPARAALCILVCGALFCFANPPFQTPDETSHFLRSWSISQGHLDFDYARTYPQDLARLAQAFPGAWVSAHTSVALGQDEAGTPRSYSSAGYALKMRGEGARVESVADSFAAYFDPAAPDPAPLHEPIVVMVLPFLPQALGIFIARLLGFGALGCLYGARLANLAVYAALCWAALRGCRRYQPVFLAVMLLPLSLFMAASVSYDATLLGFYYLVASYYCRDEITDRDVYWFLFAFWMMNAAKPWLNLLWVALPLILPRAAWKSRWKKWQAAAAALAGALALTAFVEWYGGAFRYNYPAAAFDRMLGEAVVDQLGQLRFILGNLPRYLAVMLGTLYENLFFVGQLGTFGWLDLPVPLINLLSPVLLVFAAALSVHEKSSLRALPAFGLGGLSVLYMAGAMTAMYITYTPVGMVRILGLQARYFLPAFLMLTVLLAALLSHVLRPRLAETGRQAALRLGLWVPAGFAALGAVLLFQHYFIGPVYLLPG